MLINPLRQLKKKTMKKMGISSGKSFRKMEKKRRREMAKKILAEKGVLGEILVENKSFAQELKDIEELKEFARENPNFNFTVNMPSGTKISHFENPENEFRSDI